ncbi:MAG: FAD:protein FMN transferase [Ghiorsea sp.]|nr:FAD:protein FMN transferase [Ghiorsea sp.]
MLKFIWGVLTLLLLLSCQSSVPDVKETRLLLGTVVTFTVSGVPEDLALQAITQAATVMQQVENKFTTHGDMQNTVKAFNQAAVGEAIHLDVAVDKLLQQSIIYWQQTQAAFDPTLGDLNKRWGFSGDKAPSKPLSKAEVQQGLMRSGADKLRRISPQTWVKDKAGIQLDFGAIAKGLAIDKGIEALRQSGVEHAIINAGGDIRILGDHRGQPWRIAIRHPRQDVALGWVDISKGTSIVTSGDYERFFISQGKRYHHIIDPKTGFPAMKSMSVTVQADTAMQADALSTALFILGFEQGLPMVEKMVDVEAVWVDAKGNVHMSSGMKSIFQSLEKKKLSENLQLFQNLPIVA